MTREEEIYKAAENNTEIECCLVAEDDFEVCDITDSFIAGAKWADDHPAKWHDASEEPDIEDTYVYILYIDKYDCPRLQLLNDILTYYDNKTTWNEAVKLCGISKWAYLRDLLPKINKLDKIGYDK